LHSLHRYQDLVCAQRLTKFVHHPAGSKGGGSRYSTSAPWCGSHACPLHLCHQTSSCCCRRHQPSGVSN
jgi:hypothetical protein